jgi:hypothetical protein
MKTRSTKNIFLRASMALAVMIAVHTPASSWAAEPAEAKEMKMEEKMMKHMVGHMEMGKESMSKCPMMKDMDGKSDEAHAEHYEKSE